MNGQTYTAVIEASLADVRKQRRVDDHRALRRLEAVTEHEQSSTGNSCAGHQHHTGHLNRGEPREPGRRTGHASML
jgi:hypothetical protein